MDTKFTPSLNFSGRASIIKEADKICRNVNSNFPHVSPYLAWNQYHQPMEHYRAFISYWSKLDELRAATRYTDTAFDYYDVLINKLKVLKSANCGDLSDIVYLKCKNKNFDDVKLVQLGGVSDITGKKVKYDHVAVEFKHNGKSILIDPLFGFADFVQNGFLKYKGIFKRFINGYNENFRLTLFDTDTVRIQPYDLEKLILKHKDLVG